MTFNVLEDISIETPKGLITLNQGQMIKLPRDEAIPLIEEGQITPVDKSLFEKRFKALEDKLGRYAVTSDEIKAHKPEFYEGIQAAIAQMDTAWFKEDLATFLKAIKTIEELYFRALDEIPGWQR